MDQTTALGPIQRKKKEKSPSYPTLLYQITCQFTWESLGNQVLTLLSSIFASILGRNEILASLCPQVFGLYLVKLAVAMVLAGGVQRTDAAGTRTRGLYCF